MKIRGIRGLCGVVALMLAWMGGATEPYDAALEYVESDGSQYLDTGLVLTNGVSVSMVVQLRNTKTQGCVFGGRDAHNQNNISVLFLYTDQIYADYNNGSYESYRTLAMGPRVFDDPMLIELSPKKRRIVSLASPQGDYLSVNRNVNGEGAFCTPSTARIFGMCGDQGDKRWGYAPARLYSLRIQLGDEVLRDYQPCVKDGCVGLYDRATQTFLPPAVGTLAPGPVVVTPLVDVPASGSAPQLAYDGPVRYLESDGTAFLDTGVTLTSAMSADLFYEILPDSGTVGIFGARQEAGVQNISLSLLYPSDSVQWSLAADFNNGNYSNYRSQFRQLGVHEPLWSHLGGDRCVTSNHEQKVFVQAGASWSATGQSFSTPGSAYVFKTRGTTWKSAKARLYSLVIRENGAIIRDYEPYLREGVACLHDRKTDTFLFNANPAGGTFVAGEALDVSLFSVSQTNARPHVALANVGAGAANCEVFAVTSYAPVYDRAVEYLESDGSQHFDLKMLLQSDMEVFVTFAVTDYSNGPAGIFGARTSADVRNAAISYANTSQISCDFQNGPSECYNTYRASLNPTTATKIYTSVLSAQMRTLNERTNSVSQAGVEPWTTEGSATVFATKGTTWQNAKARLYSLRIRQNGATIRDYQPCVKDGRGCLYERVNGTFLYAAEETARPFAVGPTIVPAETDYADGTERIMPRTLVTTNLVLSVADGAVNRYPIEPLQPSTRYAYALVARNDLGAETRFPGTEVVTASFTTDSETVPDGASPSLRVSATPLKNGKFAFDVTRTGIAATRLHLLHGPISGDGTKANWRSDEVIGSFEAGTSTCMVLTPVLGAGNVYLRLYTEDGEWSRVVLTAGILQLPRGTLVIMR